MTLGFGHKREQIIMLNSWLGSFQKDSLIKSAPGNRWFTSGRHILCKCFSFPCLFRWTQNYPQVEKSTFYCLLGVAAMCHLTHCGMSYPSGEDHLKGLPQRDLQCLWWVCLFFCFSFSRIPESTRTFLECFKKCFGLFW